MPTEFLEMPEDEVNKANLALLIGLFRRTLYVLSTARQYVNVCIPHDWRLQIYVTFWKGDSLVIGRR